MSLVSPTAPSSGRPETRPTGGAIEFPGFKNSMTGRCAVTAIVRPTLPKVTFATDSLLEEDGFEVSVPGQQREPSATANTAPAIIFCEI